MLYEDTWENNRNGGGVQKKLPIDTGLCFSTLYLFLSPPLIFNATFAIFIAPWPYFFVPLHMAFLNKHLFFLSLSLSLAKGNNIYYCFFK